VIELTQNLKNGKMELTEVPFPFIGDNQILVQVYYSAISTGTEGKTVKDARASYIQKAKSRKEEVKKVFKSAQQHGVAKTYQMVMDKLEMPSPLGYSCSGKILKVGKNIVNFTEGDLVACGGGSASHAEIIAVPENLCVKIKEEKNLEYGSFTTIGAIALQGIRQTELTLGSNCVVIGLGLIGQITIQLLKSAGIDAIGIDLDQSKVDLASKFTKTTLLRSDEHLTERIFKETDGYGTDAVIITAGSSSLDPVELAGEICRKKGKVIIVGSVPTGFSRKNYFKKELDLRMSSSYGPGRYDNNYEEKGIDYPIGYVRWTENRNMQAFAKLIEQKKIDIAPLISHLFAFKDSIKAYDMIISQSEPFLGICLKYDRTKTLINDRVVTNKTHSAAELNIGFIGAGSFANNFLLPNLPSNVTKTGVATARPHTAKNIGNKYGFSYCTCEGSEIVTDKKTNIIFIATRHNQHAKYVLEGLRNNKHVFVEKPLCLSETELAEIRVASLESKGKLLVGYNRRFSPLITKARQEIDETIPVVINYRINASSPPPDHWTLDLEVGGGRVLGELCHFIDLAFFITKSKLTSLSARKLDTNLNSIDSCVVNLSFENGSIASITYVANGHADKSKEYLEIFSGKKVITVDDFQSIEILGQKSYKSKLPKQDKGHKNEIHAFCDSILKGSDSPIPLKELITVSKATFAVIKSCNSDGSSIQIC
jgi:predicted dehydrogenase/threonine dehydrogenase-like Zn-dependent dehydrogenase